jgi:hypothetical protein
VFLFYIFLVPKEFHRIPQRSCSTVYLCHRVNPFVRRSFSNVHLTEGVNGGESARSKIATCVVDIQSQDGSRWSFVTSCDGTPGVLP